MEIDLVQGFIFTVKVLGDTSVPKSNLVKLKQKNYLKYYKVCSVMLLYSRSSNEKISTIEFKSTFIDLAMLVKSVIFKC